MNNYRNTSSCWYIEQKKYLHVSYCRIRFLSRPIWQKSVCLLLLLLLLSFLLIILGLTYFTEGGRGPICLFLRKLKILLASSFFSWGGVHLLIPMDTYTTLWSSMGSRLSVRPTPSGWYCVCGCSLAVTWAGWVYGFYCFMSRSTQKLIFP